MPHVKTRFSLDAFILQMLQIPPEQLSLEQLREWVMDLALEDDLFRHHIRFSDRTYQRQLVCRTPRFDLLILCWRPGQCSTIHDHTDSLNVTRVYRGLLTSREFTAIAPSSAAPSLPTERFPALQQTSEALLTPGELVTVPRYGIHQLANTSSENLVTLHVYARPLSTIQVYCPRTGSVEAVPIALLG